jgi:hypothetical protein
VKPSFDARKKNKLFSTFRNKVRSLSFFFFKPFTIEEQLLFIGDDFNLHFVKQRIERNTIDMCGYYIMTNDGELDFQWRLFFFFFF